MISRKSWTELCSSGLTELSCGGRWFSDHLPQCPSMRQSVFRSLGSLLGWALGLWSPRWAGGVTVSAARWALGPSLHPKPSFQEERGWKAGLH